MNTPFQLSGLLVMPFWVLMIALPGWRWSQRILRSPLVALPAALLYVALVVPLVPEALPVLLRPELDAVAALLATPAGATVAWAHFLAFDLFVGRWVYLDARGRGLPWWVSSPVLFFVLMFGPLGFAAHLGLRALPFPARPPT
jgi:hypothetical protein